MKEKLRPKPRIARALRQVASALATGVGMLLLLADSTNDCEVYKSFKDEFDFVSTCTPSVVGGSGGTSGVSGTSGFGAATTSGTGGIAGTEVTAGTAGAAGSTATISGHVSLSIPKMGSDGDAEIRAGESATASFRAAGLDVLDAGIRYSGECSGGEGTGKVHALTLVFGSQYDSLICETISLPVRGERTVTCAQESDGASAPKTCTVTFTP